MAATDDMDGGQLRDAYMYLQRKFHPDKFAAADDRERRYAMQVAAFVNEAYETLSVPLKRAEYRLQLQGVDTGAETDARMDPMFLMEQMEWRETLEGITPGSDSAYDQLDDLREVLRRSIAELSTAASAHLDSGNTGDARDVLRKWQFVEKLVQEADAVEAGLDESDET